MSWRRCFRSAIWAFLIVLVLLAGGLLLVAFAEQTGEPHAARLRACRRIGNRRRRPGRAANAETRTKAAAALINRPVMFLTGQKE